MNSSQKAVFDLAIDDTSISACRDFYELKHWPRGRICRIVETGYRDSECRHYPACASPLTNLQRAIITAKKLGWIKESVTLHDCVAESDARLKDLDVVYDGSHVNS